MQKKIFVSHAVADADALATPFVHLLTYGMEIPRAEVFYSSRRSLGIPGGANFASFIREQVQSSTTVLALITPTFLTRAFCWSEVGAAWVLTHDVIPLLAPGVTWSDLSKTVLNGINGFQLDRTDDLDHLRDQLLIARGQSLGSTGDWNEARDRFLVQVQTWLSTQRVPKEGGE